MGGVGVTSVLQHRPPSRVTATGASIPSGTDVSLTYRVDDKVSGMTAGGITRSYSFDQFGRQSSWVDSSAVSVVHKNHYDGSSDSPTWSTDSAGVWSRNVTDLSGNVALVVTGTTSGTGSAPVFVPTGSTMQISDMHGDFVATMATDTGTNTLSSSCAFDDYGATFQSAGLSPSGKYGWLGAKERPTELTGLMLMGVRVYNPATGRFLQVDPVLGGNAGPYLYPTDPILMLDLNGMWNWKAVLSAASTIAGAIALSEICAVVCTVTVVVIVLANIVVNGREDPLGAALDSASAFTGGLSIGIKLVGESAKVAKSSSQLAKAVKSSKSKAIAVKLKKVSDTIGWASLTYQFLKPAPPAELKRYPFHHDY
jgi:RHS repeat-associated protein